MPHRYSGAATFPARRGRPCLDARARARAFTRPATTFLSLFFFFICFFRSVFLLRGLSTPSAAAAAAVNGRCSLFGRSLFRRFSLSDATQSGEGWEGGRWETKTKHNDIRRYHRRSATFVSYDEPRSHEDKNFINYFFIVRVTLWKFDLKNKKNQ